MQQSENREPDLKKERIQNLLNERDAVVDEADSNEGEQTD
jgi:hypothetical protein